MDRLKSVYSVKTDAELASELAVPLGTLQSWKKRNAIPLDALMQANIDFGTSIDWLIYGSQPVSNDKRDNSINYELEFGCSIPATEIVLSGYQLDRDAIYEVMVHIDIVRDTMVSTAGALLANSKMSKIEAITAAEKAAEKVFARLKKGKLAASD